MRRLAFLALMIGAVPAQADIVVSTHVIRANSIISAAILTVTEGTMEGAFSDPAQLVGMEARNSIYPGRPIRQSDVALPALVERNQIVELTFVSNGLSISTEGRSLSRAGAGERVRVMNLQSRTTVSGTVQPDGSILVSK